MGDVQAPEGALEWGGESGSPGPPASRSGRPQVAPAAPPILIAPGGVTGSRPPEPRSGVCLGPPGPSGYPLDPMRTLLLALLLVLASCRPEVRRTHFDGGQVWTEIGWRGGRRHGAYREWYAEGTLREEGRYRAGVPDGTWRRYHPGDQPSLEEAWEDGWRHGPSAGWYEDGTRRFEGRWERGDRVGTWTWWRPDGSQDALEEWEAGTRVSLRRF